MTTQARIDTHPQGAAIVQIDNSKHANTMVVCAIISGICLSLTFGMWWHTTNREREVNNKLQISENHWRDIEVRVKYLEGLNDDSRRR